MNKSGFSLVEVMIFITILGLFFISAISLTIYTVRDMRISQNRVIASKYAQEMVEWLKAEKETDWSEFYSKASAIAPGCREFNMELGLQTSTYIWDNKTDTCTASTTTPREIGIFRRKITFTVPSTSLVQIKVNVVWKDGRLDQSVPIDTVFVPWQ